MKTKFLISVLFWLSTLTASAKVLVISDIDDTIKISHVNNVRDAAANTVYIGNHFRGMSELYRSLDAPSGIQFSYVTNAPASLMTTVHQTFLFVNHFPDGILYLKETLFQADFKIKKIPELIRKESPEEVILIGDNGEQDPIIYSQVQNMFPQIPMHIYIHEVYSVKSPTEPGNVLRQGEIPYATSVDLAQEFLKIGLLTENAYQDFILEIVPKILSEPVDKLDGELAFPSWMNCQDYRPQLKTETEELMRRYQSKLKYRCNLR